jgi:hypothetical protein
MQYSKSSEPIWLSLPDAFSLDVSLIRSNRKSVRKELIDLFSLIQFHLIGYHMSISVDPMMLVDILRHHAMSKYFQIEFCHENENEVMKPNRRFFDQDLVALEDENINVIKSKNSRMSDWFESCRLNH